MFTPDNSAIVLIEAALRYAMAWRAGSWAEGESIRLCQHSDYADIAAETLICGCWQPIIVGIITAVVFVSPSW